MFMVVFSVTYLLRMWFTSIIDGVQWENSSFFTLTFQNKTFESPNEQNTIKPRYFHLSHCQNLIRKHACAELFPSPPPAAAGHEPTASQTFFFLFSFF